MIRDLIQFAWRRDSCSAFLLIMGIAEYLSIKDMRSMADYMTQLAEFYKRAASDKEYDAKQA